jgi:HK97 family phage major capsid protein
MKYAWETRDSDFAHDTARMAQVTAECAKLGININEGTSQDQIVACRRAINQLSDRAQQILDSTDHTGIDRVTTAIETLGHVINDKLNRQDRDAKNAATEQVLTGGRKSHDEVVALAKDEPFPTSGGRPYNFGFGDYVAAMATGTSNPEIRNALSENSDSAGGYSVPSELMQNVIDDMRAATIAIRAGAQTVPLTTDETTMLKIVKDPVPTWRSENAAVAESDPNFGALVFRPKSLAVIVRASRELISDSRNIDTALSLAFAASMAQALDKAAIYGTGADNQPLGLLGHNIPTITMADNGAAFTDYAPLLDLIELYENNFNWDMEGRTMVMNPSVKRQLAGLVNSENDPLRQPEELYQIPRLVSTNVPNDEVQGTAKNCSSVILGDWSKMLIGLRDQMRIEVLRESFAQNMQVGFLCWMRADVQIMHERSFARLAGITPKAGSTAPKVAKSK